MSQWKETLIFLACREHKHEKKFLLIGYIPSSLDCFSITKKLQRVFSSMSNCDNFLVNEIGNAQFYCKLKYANLVERNSLRNQGIHLL